MISFDASKVSQVSYNQIIPENILLADMERTPYIYQVGLNPSDNCNHKCPWCYTQNRRNDKSIQLNKLYGYFSKFIKFGGKSVVMTGGGEPLLYKELYQPTKEFENSSITKYLINNSIWVGLITNGELLDKFINADFDIKKLMIIRVSLDATNKKEHSLRHQCDETSFNKICDSIYKSVCLRGNSKTPAIGISFVISCKDDINNTLHDITEICNLAKLLKVDFVQFKHLNTKNMNEAYNDLENIHRYCMKNMWNDIEFWVQKYKSVLNQKCLVTQYLQEIGKNNNRFPCCYNYGETRYFNQADFSPNGRIIENCNTSTCRFNEINTILNSENKWKYEKVLINSLKKFGFHPYRFTPTAPEVFLPFICE